MALRLYPECNGESFILARDGSKGAAPVSSRDLG